MAPLSVTISDILDSSAAFHVSRAVLNTKRPKRLHVQDYFEVFWIVNGKAQLHLHDSKRKLAEGDLTFVPPNCAHALQGVGEECHVVNLVMPRRDVQALIHRHSQLGQFFLVPDIGESGGSIPPPITVQRSIRERADLASSARLLEEGPRDQLQLEAFILPLVRDLLIEQSNMPKSVPDWLRDALTEARGIEVFRQGAAGLVAQAGRAHAHVARSMKLHFDMTPSDYVNACRMEYAARQLAGSQDNLADIAEAVGISNMSHFHRMFRSKFGMTPRQYRLKYQKDVIQPER